MPPDEVIRANFAVDPCQREAIRGHDDVCDRGIAEACVEHEPDDCRHEAGHVREPVRVQLLCECAV